MSNLPIHTLDGTSTETLALPAVFGVEPKKALLHQAVVMYLANNRLNNAHTKTRGDVSGGGRKPWKQKGTGRARAGSSRSPLWIGGGITFGPRSNDNYKQTMPVKMRRLALAMAISAKIKDNKLSVVENFNLTDGKTKGVVALVNKVAPTASSVLLINDTLDATLFQASRNLPTTALIVASDLNTYDVLNFDTLIMTKTAVDQLAKLLGEGK